MIKAITATVLVGLASFCWNTDETVEPPLKYSLVVNGTAHELTLGNAIQIEGEFTNPSVELKAASTRHFSFGDIEFEYPASFGWEAEVTSDSEKGWTLSGQELTVMYMIMAADVDAALFLELMAGQLGIEGARPTGVTRQLGGNAHEGFSLSIQMGAVSLLTEAFALPSNGGTRLLVLQSNADSGDWETKECKVALALLSKTFVDHLGPDKSEK